MTTRKSPAKPAPKRKPAATPNAPAAKEQPGKEPRRRGFDPDAKITLLVEENPRRPGSARFEQFEIARRIAERGGSVGDYRKAGGMTGTLRRCVSRGWIRVG